MKQILIYVNLLLLLSSVAVLTAAEKAETTKKAKTTEAPELSEADAKAKALEEFIFVRVERRDPFYSAIATVEAKKAIEDHKTKLQNEGDETGTEGPDDNGGPGPVIPDELEPIKKALVTARYHGKRASLALLDGKWDITISEADEGLTVLRKTKVPPPFVKEVNSVVLQLNGFRNTAQEAKLNEEAEAKFNALKLEVQGIMWSADKRSMAIISGEAYFVQDKIGEDDDAVTIVNIDPNRVDFMINHQRKRFEFKRYINN